MARRSRTRLETRSRVLFDLSGTLVGIVSVPSGERLAASPHRQWRRIKRNLSSRKTGNIPVRRSFFLHDGQSWPRVRPRAGTPRDRGLLLVAGAIRSASGRGSGHPAPRARKAGIRAGRIVVIQEAARLKVAQARRAGYRQRSFRERGHYWPFRGRVDPVFTALQCNLIRQPAILPFTLSECMLQSCPLRRK